MDTPSASPGLFSYLQHQPPAGTTPFHATAKFLRLTGFLTLAYAGLSVLEALLDIATASDRATYNVFTGQYESSAIVTGAIVSLVISLAIAGGISFWISYTYANWCRRTANGWNHAQYLSITMIVLGGLGTLMALIALPFIMAFFALAGAFGAVLGLILLVTIAAQVAVLALGILILSNRNKSHAAFGIAPPQPMAPMTPQ